MPTNPIPLREALREAVRELQEAALASGPKREKMYRLYRAMDRVAALIEQIPADTETNDAE
jgi:hypothetical protein